jgi:hypothetical protein
MRENRTSGSVRGALGNRRSYREIRLMVLMRGLMSKEPEQLRRGKAFHLEVQADWASTAEGNVNLEHTISLLPFEIRMKSVRRGRLDILVNEIGDQVAVVEIKATDWDRIYSRNISKNLSAHCRQILKYVDKYLEGDGFTVCPGLIYPTAPATPGLKERVEEYLNNNGIAVAWFRD